MENPNIFALGYKEFIPLTNQHYVVHLLLKLTFLRIRNGFLSIAERYQLIKCISPLTGFRTLLLIWKSDVLTERCLKT